MIAARSIFAGLAFMLLAAAGCNYTKPVMYIDVVNRSGDALRNIEVKHPSGVFGLPELRDQQTHQYTAPKGTPCKFNLEFENAAGKKYSGAFDLGAKCPTEVAFEIGSAMSVIEKQVRP